jgi:hypothetical protein
LEVVARIRAREVVAALSALIEIYGTPLHLRCDNGGEFIGKYLQLWLAHAGVQTRFIVPFWCLRR